MSEQRDDGVQRWTAKRRAALIVSILRGETTAQEASRQHGLTIAEIDDWKEKFLSGAENALRSKPRDEEAIRDEREKRLKAKIGDLVLELDILKEAIKGRLFVPPTSEE